VVDQPGRSLRLAVGLAIVTVGLTEAYSLLAGLRSERRLRDVEVRAVRAEVGHALPGLREALRSGGSASWEKAAALALAASVASEVEVLAADGQPLLSVPTVPPVGHRPAQREAQALGSGEVVTVTAQSGPFTRVLSYVPFHDDGRSLFLRLSTAAPALQASVQERQRAVFAHLLALAVLTLAGALLFARPSGRGEPAPPARVLDAYEEALGRLRDRGLEMSREHEAERQRMEAELRDREAMARAGELTAGIVHEVRNGLGTILGYARILEREGTGPNVIESAQSIREECETLEVVVRRFMQFVRQETLSPATFDLERMLARVVSRESRGRSGAHVTLTPSTPGGEPIEADEELLERAFENLIRNARDAAGAEGHVHVALAREGDEVAVAIEDDGPGLPAETGGTVKPFFTTKPGGLGLGLPIALKIVRLHRGVLTLETRSPRGARATVRLAIHSVGS
jgi:signal transduction histidine kinase